MEHEKAAVWRSPKDPPTASELGKADLIVSELVTDPGGNYNKFYRLDEMRANVQARLSIQKIHEEFEEYKLSKNQEIIPTDDTRLTTEMFEQD